MKSLRSYRELTVWQESIRLDRKDLRDYAALSCRRKIRNYLANAAGCIISTSEHRGRTGPADDWGSFFRRLELRGGPWWSWRPF